MNCRETQALMDPYMDRELDLVRSLEIERHLQDCPECARTHAMQMDLRAQLGGHPLLYRAPESLRRNLATALSRQESGAPARPRFSVPWQAWGAVAAAVVLAAVVWLRPVDNPVEREVVASHVRSLMADHLTDVTSTDQHTVKPWFAGKLDFSPEVKDLAAQGFPLTGGRLDYVNGRAVAALVYQRRKHLINVFIWPAGGEQGPRASVRQGFNVVERRHGGMQYWLVSDVERGDLEQLAGWLTGAQAQ